MSGDDERKRIGPDDDPDRYLLHHEVATGGEGTLFRGSITVGGLTLDVAVKQLLADHAPVHFERWQEDWTRQVELLRTLQGPGVVPVREGFAGALPHAAGEVGTGRTLYLVMNWVEGEPVHQWMRHHPHEDPFDTVERLLAVATALDDMHAGKTTGGIPVLHRDLKPSNILVSDAGAVLVDFGLIRALPDGPRISGWCGTVGYIAPESTREGIYAPATDRYGFGAVVYYVFTGTEAPRDHDEDALRANLAAAPALAGRPDAVDHLMEALDADPSARSDSLCDWLTRLRGSTTIGPGRHPDAGLQRRAEELRTGLVDLAEAAISLESDGDLAFLRAQIDTGGRAAAVARDVVASLGQFWETYTVAKQLVDDLDAAIASGRGDEAHRLLGPDAIALADGTATGADALWKDLQDRLGKAADSVHRQAEVARGHLALLDARRASVRDLHQRASALGATDDVEVAAVLAALAEAETAFTLDPWAPGPTGGLDGAIEVACGHVDDLERRRATLPGRLGDARSQLAEISVLGPRGSDAFNEAVDKIAEPEGLLQPLDPSAVEGDGSGDDRALRPWLVTIERLGQQGDWRAADEGLRQWHAVADAWLADATAVIEANQRPKAERDLLRGRLDGFRAMAGTAGRSEDPTLTQLYRAAHDALYVAPCDLALARSRVQHYIDAVNEQPSKDER